ncbi:hypothetical protein KDK95_14785 [Actinospica sp. MGRD01-02]|uniref:Uncharacterized protein n=1 Tax=Actinospica acidithermotolerans TaxID=2828514 RepID=A0A941EAF6_9ACTN|nr:hypothetical protein [Actinospica acidithermotolerans]MBR7827582.1 hypothetical protein [Actinospica acidithermotolerans]
MTPSEDVELSESTAMASTRPKTARIRPDQWTSLDDFARNLHDARSTKVERITSNTLIRVAVDGMLRHRGRLHGDTEEQLLASWLLFLEEREMTQNR